MARAAQRASGISPHQQHALAKIYELPAAELERPPVYSVVSEDAAGTAKDRAEWKERYRAALVGGNHADFYRAFGKEVPYSLKLYELLGRFRDALLAHQLKVAKHAAQKQTLKKFIYQYSGCLPFEP